MTRHKARDGPTSFVRFLAPFLIFTLAFGLLLGATPASAQNDAFIAGDQVIVDTHSLNFRADATLDAGIDQVLLDGTLAVVTDGPVTADGYTWYELDVDGAIGWSVADYLVPAGTDHALMPIGSAVMVVVDSANLRAEPGLTADVSDVWLMDTSAWVIAGPEYVDGYDWYEVDSGGVTGWIARPNLAFASSHDFTLTIDETAIVNTDFLNLRETAGLDGAVIAVLEGGAVGTLLDGPVEVDGLVWYQFETDFGTGWVVGEYLI